MKRDELLTIGEVAERSGVTTSTLRFYEEKGLIASERTPGNQRRYPRYVLRIVSFIRFAQRVGLELAEIGDALADLPRDRPPTKRDWARLSKAWERRLAERIAQLERLRNSLTSCIGCGCLSLQVCPIFNPDDQAGALGPGPRYLMGRRPEAG